MIDLTGRPHRWGPEINSLIHSCWEDSVNQLRGDLHLSGPPLGSEVLRAEIANTLGCDEDEVAVTGGVRSSIALLVPRLQRTVLEIPTFQGVEDVLSHMNCQVVRGQLNDLRGGGGALWITHPSRNPDSYCLTTADFGRINEMPWSTIVINETYRWFSDISVELPDGRWIGTGSFSKVFGLGVRIGWIRGASIPTIPVQALRTICPPAVNQIAWAYFIQRGGLASLIEHCERYVHARNAFLSCLDFAPDVSPGPTTLLSIPIHTTEQHVADELLRNGLKVSLGKNFSAPTPSLAASFVGISVETALQAGRIYASTFYSLIDQMPGNAS